MSRRYRFFRKNRLANASVPAAVSAKAPVSRPPRTHVEPLTADLNRIHVTVSRSFLKKLAAARDALSHSHPGATDEEILAAGLDLLLERAAKRRGLVEKPRKTPPPAAPGSDAVPAHVSRAVWTRDEGKCQWKLDSGGICGSTYQVQLDHIIPRALGGPSTVDNLRCACRVHNVRAAREVYGDELMDHFTRRGSRPRA